MSTSRFGRKRILVIAAVLVVAATAGGVAMASDNDDVVVTAVFADASPLVAGNVVKSAGVEVGTVKSIALEGGRAKVRMALDRSVLPLHNDVRATITTQDLLGERFIRLERGSPSAPVLPEPAVIAQTQTNRVVDLQDVLNAVDTPTATALGSLLTTSGEGLKGQGKQAAGAIAALEPAMTQARDLAAILDEQNALLTKLVDNAQPVASALATDDGQSLDRLVGSATDTLATVAANRKALQDSLVRLPGTMASARTTLAELSGVADPATRTLASLRPITDDLTDITGELHRFADAADPALASLPPVLDRANVLLDEAAPLVKVLRPATPDLLGVSAAAQTLSEQALSLRLTNLMEFLKGWSMATSDYDAISHYFKAMVPLSPKPLGQVVGGIVPGLPDAPIPSLPLPAPPELPLPGKTAASTTPAGSGQPAASPSTRGGASSAPAPGGSATGLTERQENSMLEQLLGGLL
ncbi:MlaD family protein [Candidatus Protofrankia californiensis]|uniref:MlaD family protein n=1 Tax=Candidatus Protofrankia californiensis TaxID=1839754 RepID=UPI0019D2E656|nr:MlaD family protein [Candidatus Protofrankia californiensis]